AEWAGGKVRARIDAKFLPRPAYEVTAQFEHVNLSQLPGTGRIAERMAGLAAGTLELQTEGVGRDELLSKLVGRGDFQLNKVEFRGWDVSASVVDGTARSGVSRWAVGEGSFRLKDRNIVLEELKLDDGKAWTLVSGTLSFARNADLTIETSNPRNNKDRK